MADIKKGGVVMNKLFVFAVLLVLVICACSNLASSRSNDSEMMLTYQNLLVKEKVKEVVNRLFINTDNRNWDSVSQLFASNVLFDMTSMVGGEPVTLTPKEIVTSWEKGLKPLKAIHHQTGNYIVTANRKEADVFCYGIASHYLPNKTNQNTRIFVGSYDFHLINNNEHWLIDKFKFNLKYIDGNLKLEESQ